ncbi:hypothetical protein BDN71DRAFT_1513562 [Pleurotus eryngii]|uniref:Uncharacterized protein n=1 Tax=Pleurotus eryngii TaxID=5323 RepID=A0A9P5ZHJ2_PLEER|nr:hypothetical protein BDN71DRAFT_1513562 [Pleurotus eryngii]
MAFQWFDLIASRPSNILPLFSSVNLSFPPLLPFLFSRQHAPFPGPLSAFHWPLRLSAAPVRSLPACSSVPRPLLSALSSSSESKSNSLDFSPSSSALDSFTWPRATSFLTSLNPWYALQHEFAAPISMTPIFAHDPHLRPVPHPLPRLPLPLLRAFDTRTLRVPLSTFSFHPLPHPATHYLLSRFFVNPATPTSPLPSYDPCIVSLCLPLLRTLDPVSPSPYLPPPCFHFSGLALLLETLVVIFAHTKP